MVSQAQRDFGHLDILCNNVGIQYVAPVHEFPDDKWDAMIAITLSSAFHATKAALPAMIERKWGRIINTGSMHALVASPYKSAYNAAKHGIAGGYLLLSTLPYIQRMVFMAFLAEPTHLILAERREKVCPSADQQLRQGNDRHT